MCDCEESMAEEVKVKETEVGVCQKIGGYYNLPINEYQAIERCEQDPNFFDVKNQASKMSDKKTQILIGLSRFFNTYEKTQIFLATALENACAKAAVIRFNGNYAVIVFEGLLCQAAVKPAYIKYNSFVFNEELVYECSSPYDESDDLQDDKLADVFLDENGDAETKVVRVKKEDQFFGTLKEFFSIYGCVLGVDIGQAVLDEI